MKSFVKLTALFLSVFLTLTLFASCGKNKDNDNQPEATFKAVAVKDMKIGVLFTDNAVSTGDSFFHLKGLENAAKEIGLDAEKQIIIKKNITDVTFSETSSFVPEAYSEKETVSEKQEEPSTFLDKNGNPVVEAVPVNEKTPETALDAVSSLLDSGCNIIIATDRIYDAFSAYIAKQNSDIVVLQYQGTSADIANLHNYDTDIYEAFYLAGAVAGSVSKEGNIGFICGIQNDEAKKNINAFSLGALEANKDSKITLSATNVPLDLGLERSLPAELISADGCDFIIQSVYTALPQTVAENSRKEFDHEPVPCIGYGYDMSADADTQNICSVIIDYSVFFKDILTSLSEGKFSSGSFTGDILNGGVHLSEFRTDNENLTKITDSLKTKFTEDYDLFKDFTPSENGYAANVTVK